VERLKDLDPATRLEAVGHVTTAATEGDEALRRRLQVAVPGLRGLLRDKHEHIRLAAARALMTIDAGKESSAALPVLVGGLDSKDNAETAVAALAALGTRETAVREALAAALVSKTQSGAGRCRAAEVLGRVGLKEPATIKALTEAARDRDPDVSSTSARILEQLDPLARMRLEVARFREGLKAQDARDRLRAVKRLGDHLLQAGKGRDAAALKEGDRALFEALADPAARVRHRAILAIHHDRYIFGHKLGPDTDAIVRALQRAANDANDEVRGVARLTLALKRR
jgi:HEAT repeat protein